MSSNSSTTPVKTDPDQTSISLNDTESIRRQEPKKQVNIVISYIEQNDEQGIGQLVKPSLSLRTSCTASRLVESPFLVYSSRTPVTTTSLENNNDKMNATNSYAELIEQQIIARFLLFISIIPNVRNRLAPIRSHSQTYFYVSFRSLFVLRPLDPRSDLICRTSG